MTYAEAVKRAERWERCFSMALSYGPIDREALAVLSALAEENAALKAEVKGSTPVPGLSEEDERALTTLAELKHSSMRVHDWALGRDGVISGHRATVMKMLPNSYPDIRDALTHLRSRLSATPAQPAEPCPGNLNCPVCLSLERADDGKPAPPEDDMKPNYDFSKGRRGAVVQKGKEK